jgi:hypothetical protein
VACMGHLLGGHQRRPVPHRSQLLLNSKPVRDTTENFHVSIPIILSMWLEMNMNSTGI